MTRAAALVLAILVALAPGTAAAAPRVVASIPPVHGLVAAVMEGAGAPHPLIPAEASPHHFALRPSDAKALAAADLVFVVGAGLEGALIEAAGRLAPDAALVELAEVPGIATLPAVPEDHDEAGHDHGDAGIDPHLWLDPDIARRWLGAIAAALADADPANAALYRANAAEEDAALELLARGLESDLAAYAGRDYAVLHDAFRYFERRFGLGADASLTPPDGAAPGARGVAEFGERLRAMNVPCLFAEPGRDVALVESIARDSGARTGVLDPLGQGIAPGPGFYPELLRTIARDFTRCHEGGA